MARRSKPNPNATPGFAIPIHDDTDLGLAILVAEIAGGRYLPIAVVVSINEAKEIAEGDMDVRMRDLEAGKAPECPQEYVVWAHGLDGYCVAGRIPAN